MKKLKVHLDNYFEKSEDEKGAVQDAILNDIVTLVAAREVELLEVFEFLDNHREEAVSKELYEVAQYFLDLKNKLIELFEFNV